MDGIHLGIQRAGEWLPQSPDYEFAWYVCENLEVPEMGTKRWDGPITPPLDPEFKTNPQVLVAVTAYGIRNAADPLPWNLYSGDQLPGVRTALLGAVRFAVGAYRVDLAFGPLGFHYCGGILPLNGSEVDGAWVVPEPGSALLLVLVGLAARRR